MIDLEITTAEGTKKVTVGPADLIRFERKYDVGVTQFDAGTLRFEWLAFLAWSVLKRQGDTTVEFDAWIDSLEGLNPVGAEGKDGDAAAS
jgi:hypothetical protein